MEPRLSTIANDLSGHFCVRWQAAPMPDSPAPTIRTSTCSAVTTSEDNVAGGLQMTLVLRELFQDVQHHAARGLPDGRLPVVLGRLAAQRRGRVDLVQIAVQVLPDHLDPCRQRLDRPRRHELAVAVAYDVETEDGGPR